MKIFNNFNTKFKDKEYKRLVGIYGKENVLLIQRCFFYFIVSGIIPFLLFLIFSIVLIITAYYFRSIPYLFNSTITIICLFAIFVIRIVFNSFLDYKYDFTTFTPQRIFTYKQKGLLNSDFKDLPSKEVRSIVSFRNGLIGNVFGFGTVKIYTDGGIASDKNYGRSQAGRTKLSYVNNPNKVREKILNICVGKDGIDN